MEPPHHGDCLFINVGTFARRMRVLERYGYRMILLAEACEQFADGTLASRDVVITIDDCWQHMFPVLEHHRFPATLYIATESVLRAEPLVHLLSAYLVACSSTPPEAYGTLLPSSRSPCTIAQALTVQISNQPTPAAHIAKIKRITGKLELDEHELAERIAFHLVALEEARTLPTCPTSPPPGAHASCLQKETPMYSAMPSPSPARATRSSNAGNTGPPATSWPRLARTSSTARATANSRQPLAHALPAADHGARRC